MPQARSLLSHHFSSSPHLFLPRRAASPNDPRNRLRCVSCHDIQISQSDVVRQHAWHLARAWAGAVRVRPFGCSKADAWSLSYPGVSRPSLVQGQLLSDGREQLPHILGSLGGCLEEQKSGLAGVSLGLRGGDGPLVGLLGDEIQLVPGQGDDDVLVGLALELLDPCLRLIQR